MSTGTARAFAVASDAAQRLFHISVPILFPMSSPASSSRFRFLAGVVAILSGLLVASCSKTSDAPKPAGAAATPGAVKIGFLVKQPEEPWFQLEWKFAEQASKELGFALVKIGATDGEKVLAAIDNLAANGAQGFVICTPDTKLGPAIAN